MNVPVRIPPPPRWAASETEAAHALLEKLYARLDPESDGASMVFHAMEAVEAADCDLERGAGA